MSDTQNQELDNDILNTTPEDLMKRLDLALAREVKPEEIEYVKAQMPFLQIINIEFDEAKLSEPRLVNSNKGWVMHDYDQAISSSPGEDMWNNAHPEDDDEGGDGTVVDKSFNTAIAMVQLAEELGWLGISVMDGTTIMKWAAWLEAEKLGLAVHGFEPTEQEIKKLERIGRSEADIRTLRERLEI